MSEPSLSGESNRAGGSRVRFARPSTRPGWWAAGLLAVFVVMMVVNVTVFLPVVEAAPWREVWLPVYIIAMLSTGLAAGIAGLFAVARRHERSLLVWLTLLPGVMVILLLLGELLGPEH